MGIANAIELMRQSRDEASESLRSGPITDSVIAALIDKAALWVRSGHSVGDALEHAIIASLCLGYRIAVEETAAKAEIDHLRGATRGGAE
jgi:hypothetical protein